MLDGDGDFTSRHEAQEMMSPASLRIRPLRAIDIDPCARLIATDPLWQRYHITLTQARGQLRKVFAATHPGGRGTGETGEFAVAHSAGQVVGFIWFRLEGTFHHSGYIRWIGVAPHVQGQGVGAELMAYAERKIFTRGPNVFLMVSAFNAGAQKFYKRLGYTQIGAVPNYAIGGITERLFRKTRGPLSAPGARSGARRPRSASRISVSVP
jgi:ribosomal protein S18 acetylase RimI-like enzyme